MNGGILISIIIGGLIGTYFDDIIRWIKNHRGLKKSSRKEKL